VAGGVQWMCAGRGILHAEMPVEEPGKPEPRGLQLWIDLPKEFKMSEPSYQELDPNQIPSAFPNGPDGPVEIKVISGSVFGVQSPVRPLGGCWYFHVKFKAASSVFVDLREHILLSVLLPNPLMFDAALKWTSFMYIIKGSVQVGAPGSETSSDEFHTFVLSADEEETGVSIATAKAGTEILLCAGEPLDQAVVQYGPFVMTSTIEIRNTIRDCRYTSISTRPPC
jgi:redox-sensitive bicupin YhaK (pirin superfamily)